MPWMTGPAWAQVQGLDNIYRSAPTPTPAPAAPVAPAGGDYWAQLSSLLGMPQAGGQPAYTPWWQAQQQRAVDVVPGAGMSIPGAGAYFAQMQQRAQQQAQAPSSMYGNMPMVGQPSQQFLPGSNQGRSNPFRRADGSVITPEAYMAGDRAGMTGRSNYQGQPAQPPAQRPTLAPPTTAGRRPKTPSATFGTPSEREPAVRPSIPGFSNFVY